MNWKRTTFQLKETLGQSLELGGYIGCIDRVKHMAFLGLNMNPLASTQLVSLKLNITFFQSIKGVIFSHSDIISRMESRTSLANDDVTRYHLLQNKIKKKMEKEISRQYMAICFLLDRLLSWSMAYWWCFWHMDLYPTSINFWKSSIFSKRIQKVATIKFDKNKFLMPL